MKITSSVCAMSALFALVSAPLAAAPFAYDEAVQGDLTGLSGPAPFALEAGANTVRGTAGYGRDGSIDFDSFAFDLGVGETLVSIDFSWVLADVIEGTTALRFTNQLLAGFPHGPLLATQTVHLFSGTSTGMFSAALPLGPGTYTNDGHMMGRTGPGGAWNYVWTLNVRRTDGPTDVPEPAALGLFGLGVAALAARRRRRA